MLIAPLAARLSLASATGLALIITLMSLLGQHSGAPQLALQVNRSGHYDLYLYDLNWQHIQRLYRGELSVVGPDWSPDGQSIVFSGRHENRYDLYLISSNGRHLERMTVSERNNYLPRWSPDGEQLVFLSDRLGNWDIYQFDVATGEEINLTNSETEEMHPVWSPDGTQIAFVSGPGDHRDLFVMQADGSEMIQITDDVANEGSLNWSAVGDRLLWVSERGPGNRCASRTAAMQRCLLHVDIFSIRPDGSDPKQLTVKTGSYWSPYMADDGTLIYTSNVPLRSPDEPYWALYRRGPSDDDAVRLTDRNHQALAAAWRPR